ncbi:unnamed protein product [Rotaria magnacalcarata]|uniref:Uncharacterized protein n=1 Tax=Rotaria magnacalcarata TaxID=392030 RepID=A0A819VP15_9BILA|nr:unnamed protein product [Rotaria magnacalcarata]CAF4124680.1 unnamed protein product [Rotaria magnacalcarata]CAF4713846.1 unnamed protein product [Rotaria magnacalcarata]CAF4763355.1 unnamed protein product [Rotaria magnacalcarata]
MANTSTTVAIDTSIPSEKSALFQRNASPLEIGSAFEAEMKRLYCEGRLEEYARELYTDDCKLWTDDKRQLFGRNAVHQETEDDIKLRGTIVITFLIFMQKDTNILPLKNYFFGNKN